MTEPAWVCDECVTGLVAKQKFAEKLGKPLHRHDDGTFSVGDDPQRYTLRASLPEMLWAVWPTVPGRP